MEQETNPIVRSSRGRRDRCPALGFRFQKLPAAGFANGSCGWMPFPSPGEEDGRSLHTSWNVKDVSGSSRAWRQPVLAPLSVVGCRGPATPTGPSFLLRACDIDWGVWISSSSPSLLFIPAAGRTAHVPDQKALQFGSLYTGCMNN